MLAKNNSKIKNLYMKRQTKKNASLNFNLKK